MTPLRLDEPGVVIVEHIFCRHRWNIRLTLARWSDWRLGLAFGKSSVPDPLDPDGRCWVGTRYVAFCLPTMQFVIEWVRLESSQRLHRAMR